MSSCRQVNIIVSCVIEDINNFSMDFRPKKSDKSLSTISSFDFKTIKYKILFICSEETVLYSFQLKTALVNIRNRCSCFQQQNYSLIFISFE